MAQLLQTVGPRSGGAPLTYTLTEPGTLDLQSVFAHFDGSGASGAFRPTLTIKAQNGTILARLFPIDEPAAGDTADVTYSPFFRRQEVTPTPGTFAATVAALATARDLLGYWRLGEAASPFADTSGHSGGAADQVITAGGVAMTTQVGGALPPAQDDGAVRFNALGVTVGDFLTATHARFGLNDAFTIAAFVIPQVPGAQSTQAVGNWSALNGGYGLFITGAATASPVIFVGDAGGTTTLVGSPLSLTDYTFIVITQASSGTRRIFRNGALDVEATSAQGIAPFGYMRIGTATSGVRQYGGDVDEVSVWGEPLSAVEVLALAEAAGYA